MGDKTVIKRAISISAIIILVANLVYLAYARNLTFFWLVLIVIGLGAMGVNKLIDRK